MVSEPQRGLQCRLKHHVNHFRCPLFKLNDNPEACNDFMVWSIGVLCEVHVWMLEFDLLVPAQYTVLPEQ